MKDKKIITMPRAVFGIVPLTFSNIDQQEIVSKEKTIVRGAMWHIFQQGDNFCVLLYFPGENREQKITFRLEHSVM